MQTRTLFYRSLAYYCRANAAVIAGVATAVAVLAGALLVGDSVRSSLQRLALTRLGRTETVIRAGLMFRDSLADSFGRACPMIVLDGLVTHQASGRRATAVAIYGVDDRFWKLHEKQSPQLSNRQVAASAALASELGAKPGDTLLVRIEKPSDIPAESLFGRKEGAPPLRSNLKNVLDAGNLGEFSLKPQQGPMKAIFMPLSRLQKEIGFENRANVILVDGSASAPEQILKSAFALEDLGLELRELDGRNQIQLASAGGVLNDTIAAAGQTTAESLGLDSLAVMTYMATSIKIGAREIPYSLVAALDLQALGIKDSDDSTLVLNEWSAHDLGARPGDTVTMEYLAWHDDGRLSKEKAEFKMGVPVRIAGLAADRDFTPEYPGITDADSVSEWDPPFPMDLGKIRPRDEDYWNKYRTTPKAFLTLRRGQQLWGTRWGKVTALRMTVKPREMEGMAKALEAYRTKLRGSLDPLANGIAVIPVRRMSLAASQGSTDFGEYFSYFSFFLVVSALMLAGLFFRLGIEQRFAEIGLLRAVGFQPGKIRILLLREGLLLSVFGGVLGLVGALVYAGLVLLGLGSWWVDAVGTRDLSLSVSAGPMLLGLAGGVVAALLAIVLTLRGVRDITPKRLMSGEESTLAPKFKTRAWIVAIVCAIACAGMLAASAAGAIPAAGGFFGAGFFLLTGFLAAFRGVLALSVKRNIAGPYGFNLLAFRNASFRPGRTILSAALIASATFLVVSVESFRKEPERGMLDKKSGTGGYPLIAESVRPIYHNMNLEEGRQELSLPAMPGVSFVQFRLRPGDDASCLNLYQPQNPRVLGAPEEFLRQGRFGFAESEGKEANPWTLLEKGKPGGPIPAIADANSLLYVLHKNVGEEVTLNNGTRLKIVAALSDSLFQSELIISEKEFIRAFPDVQGYREFLIEAPPAQTAQLITQLESSLADLGFDATSTSEKLAGFHRVENTYLSTFQTLGGLGLLLGTVGLAAVLFRNVIERRRELALLTATGFSKERLSKLVLMENLLLLAAGLGAGVLSAAIAIAPVLVTRGVHFSIVGMAALLAAVALTGVASSWIATRVALRLPLTSSLRTG